MTISELIAKLSSLPPDLPVLVDGYEGGAKEPARVTVGDFIADKNPLGYCGPHEEIGPGESGQDDREDANAEGRIIFQAVIISRRTRA